MSKINTFFHLMLRPRDWYVTLVTKCPSLIKDDRSYIEYIWSKRMNYPLNLDEPKSFSEKLQWLKLYDRRPVYTTMVDKLAVKKYVADIIGEEYIIPTLGVWNSPEDIEWDKLPDQFVLKCTHDSGGLVICRDKSKLDRVEAVKKIKKSLRRNYYLAGREWPYKNVPRRVLAEKYMVDNQTEELRDYKFFCFNGEVKALFIATDRQVREEPFFDFFDADGNHLDFRHGHPNAPVVPKLPSQFVLMKQLAAKLSIGYPELRVDFYEVNGCVYFGELTLFHHSGWMPFDPIEWDYKMGEWIKLHK